MSYTVVTSHHSGEERYSWVTSKAVRFDSGLRCPRTIVDSYSFIIFRLIGIGSVVEQSALDRPDAGSSPAPDSRF